MRGQATHRSVNSARLTTHDLARVAVGAIVEQLAAPVMLPRRLGAIRIPLWRCALRRRLITDRATRTSRDLGRVSYTATVQ